MQYHCDKPFIKGEKVFFLCLMLFYDFRMTTNVDFVIHFILLTFKPQRIAPWENVLCGRIRVKKVNHNSFAIECEIWQWTQYPNHSFLLDLQLNWKLILYFVKSVSQFSTSSSWMSSLQCPYFVNGQFTIHLERKSAISCNLVPISLKFYFQCYYKIVWLNLFK